MRDKCRLDVCAGFIPRNHADSLSDKRDNILTGILLQAGPILAFFASPSSRYNCRESAVRQLRLIPLTVGKPSSNLVARLAAPLTAFKVFLLLLHASPGGDKGLQLPGNFRQGNQQ